MKWEKGDLEGGDEDRLGWPEKQHDLERIAGKS